MIEKNPAVTETFFNLVPRAPHAVKLLFHGLQIIFIKLIGYNLFSIRLFALFTGTGCLVAFFKLLMKLEISPLPGTVLLSVQIQFIYASHFGRQEIQILLLMLLSLNALYSSNSGFKRGILTGLPIAVAVGFHPNAFIAAWPAGLLLITGIICRRRSIKEGLGYIVLPAAAAVLFLLLSLQFNRNFVADYGSFGEEVGFFDPLDIKLLGFDDFYRKLFLRVSGTYLTPRIWPVFAAAAAASAGMLAAVIYKRLKHFISFSVKQSKTEPPAAETSIGRTENAVKLAVTGLIGVNLGILLIGKYSAPSVLFNIPFLVLLISAAIEAGGGGEAGARAGADLKADAAVNKIIIQKALYSVAAALLIVNAAAVIIEETGGNKETYEDFSRHISEAIPPSAQAIPSRVIGPLTADFCLENGRLLDYRNLAALQNAGISIEDYILENNIEYIIYTEDLDVIFENRPVWNLLYGNPTVYHQQLQDFISNHCELISEFASPGYGTRIVFHRFKKDWMIRVFRVSTPG